MRYEDHVLLEFILNARKPVSAREILAHLTDKVAGYAEKANQDGGLKNVQNRLQHIAGCEQFTRLINVTQEGRGLRYKGITTVRESETAMSIEQACALLMSDKQLSALAPTRLFQTQGEYQALNTLSKNISIGDTSTIITSVIF